MPRPRVAGDVFNAIAERHRRQILVYLAARERAVSDIVEALQLAQPSVSKHLKVLRETGLVEARRDGKQVFYRTRVDAIRPLHEWAGIFEQYWRHQLSRITQRVEERKGGKPWS